MAKVVVHLASGHGISENLCLLSKYWNTAHDVGWESLALYPPKDFQRWAPSNGRNRSKPRQFACPNLIKYLVNESELKTKLAFCFSKENWEVIIQLLGYLQAVPLHGITMCLYLTAEYVWEFTSSAVLVKSIPHTCPEHERCPYFLSLFVGSPPMCFGTRSFGRLLMKGACRFHSTLSTKHSLVIGPNTVWAPLFWYLSCPTVAFCWLHLLSATWYKQFLFVQLDTLVQLSLPQE